jgi:epidermal growth factor receptor substrate 15
MATPTAAELALVNQIFAAADPQKLGIITGDAALKIFAGTHLSSTVLGEIWSIADSDGNGFLTRKNTAVALRLIGQAQKGEAVSEVQVTRR